jgi:hypothetical protein
VIDCGGYLDLALTNRKARGFTMNYVDLISRSANDTGKIDVRTSSPNPMFLVRVQRPTD